jgi:hypothetical protein
MKRQNRLNLPEEILLLALRDREGTFPSSAPVTHALGGALLAELMLQERLAVEADKKAKWLVVRNSSPLRNEILDEALLKIRTAKRRARVETWVPRLGMIKRLRHRLAVGLCDQGILRADRSRVLLFFTRQVYPEVDPRPERELVNRLKKAIFTDTASVDARTILLVSLANATHLLRFAFDRKALLKRKARIKALSSGELAGAATAQAIQAAQAAQIAAVMASSVTTTMMVAHR